MTSIESTPPLAYLGPKGTFTQLVAATAYPNATLWPMNSVSEVFDFVQQTAGAIGVVPVENSSSNYIFETIDNLAARKGLYITESLSLNVKLALLGKKDEPTTKIHSHFAPLEHCRAWIDATYPDAQRIECSSTAEAAHRASQVSGGAALANRQAAPVYGLDVLHYPVTADMPNVTQFFAIGHEPTSPGQNQQSSYILTLSDTVGSLCSFLEPLRKYKINLKRIVSRPTQGKPGVYSFFVDVVGCNADPRIATALAEASQVCEEIRCLGSYPVRPTIDS